jgi:hypothetical protein
MSGNGVSFSILDNQLGQTPPGNGNTELVVGVGSLASFNFSPITSSNPGAFTAGGNSGPGPELAAFIANQTGNAVTYSQAGQGAAGSNTTPAASANNNAGSTAAVSITTGPGPYDDGYCVVTCISDGNNGAGQTVGTSGIVLGLSRDGGATNTQTTSMITATTITSGQFMSLMGYTTLTFSGKIYTGDQLYWVATGPTYTDAAVYSAIQAACAVSSQLFQDILVPGGSSAASGAGTLGAVAADITAFDGYMATLLSTYKRPTRLLCAARDALWGGASTESEATWMASLESAFANASSLRVGAAAGHYRFISAVDQSQMRRSCLWGAGARDSAVQIQIDLGEVDMGALANLVLPAKADKFGGGTFLYHNEGINSGLDAARFLSCWQIVGFPGVYIYNPNLFAPPGSDFNWLQHGHVIDVATSVAYSYFTKLLSKAVRVSATTGFIVPQDRNRIQNGYNAAAGNVLLPQAVSAVYCVVSGTDNILSTSTLTVTIYVVPLGYLKAIAVTIQFLNPAFVAVQQAA